MKVSCPSCQTNYNIDDKRIPPGGAKLKCANCQTTFPIQAGGASAAVPLPGNAGAPGAIPLPGNAAPKAASGGAVPLPGNAAPKAAAPAGAIPLPGNAARAPAPGAIPLPGNAARAPAPGAIPLPGNAAATPFPDPAAAYNDMFNMPTPFPTMPGEQYPPPGAGGSDQFGSWDDSTSVATNPHGSSAVPLPGASGGYDSGEEDFSQEESTRIATMPVPPAA
ncbi:MAG TPA: zinc-ribbon domain-containing protein, partial [Longimicrobium sp.]|nr:zinc-ribbon domain-containing protein [Longimicrobium sp.]